jgi:ribulose-phosphate 3-epimerase
MATCLDRKEVIARLRAVSPAVNPSILFCDFSQLAQEIRQVEEAGVHVLHIDVMDGHFVPNLTFGMPIVEAARRVTDLPLDVHLMIERPDRYVEQFREAGANTMTIHAEAVEDPRPLLDRIRKLGAVAGLAVNPPTPLAKIEACLPHCDLVLAMSVMPGFGGQEFDPVALGKIRDLRARRNLDVLIEVDGGVNPETVGACAEAGADLLVCGAAIFHTDDYAAAIHELVSLAAASVGTP